MIVWLASYPRSGNTYLRAAVASLYGWRSGKLTSAGSRAGDSGLFYALPSNPGFDEMVASDGWFPTKTHRLPGGDECPAIYVVRDGRDVLLSYARYVLRKRGLEEDLPPTAPEFRSVLSNLIHERASAYGTWGAHVTAWFQRPRTAVIRFEELIRSTECLDTAVQNLGLPWRKIEGAVVPTFAELQAMRPQNFRRGMPGHWRSEFPPDLLAEFLQENGAVLEECGYPRADVPADTAS